MRIDHDDFAREVLKLAKENVDEMLHLPGVWEIISEHFNNEALESLEAQAKDKRREHLSKYLVTPFWQRA